MARLNIEDGLFTDKRFYDLCAKCGGSAAALGELVFAWKCAQKHYLSNDGVIPFDDWKRNKLNDLIIECGLAEKLESGIYLCGTEKQFSWLKQRSDAGKKGAQRTNSARASTDDSRRTSDEFRSSSFSSSFSSSKKNNTHTASSLKSDADALWVCVKIWNEKSGDKLAKVSEIKLAGSTKRLLKLIQLRKENPLNEEEFSLAVDFISKEKFYTGDSKSGWKANFDWLLEPENSTKILDEATNKSSQKFKPPSEQEIYYE